MERINAVNKMQVELIYWVKVIKKEEGGKERKPIMCRH
jgi:hypothetical protein